MPKRPGRRLLQLIGIFKLAKALALLASLATLFHLIHRDDPLRTLIGWALTLHVDPANRYLRTALVKLLDLNPSQLNILATGTLLYAALFATEGVGLLLDLTWGEYLTIVETAGFIPLEAYEISQRASALKTTVLLLNLATVVYLVIRVHRQRTTSVSMPVRRDRNPPS